MSIYIYIYIIISKSYTHLLSSPIWRQLPGMHTVNLGILQFMNASTIHLLNDHSVFRSLVWIWANQSSHMLEILQNILIIYLDYVWSESRLLLTLIIKHEYILLYTPNLKNAWWLLSITQGSRKNIAHFCFEAVIIWKRSWLQWPMSSTSGANLKRSGKLGGLKKKYIYI